MEPWRKVQKESFHTLPELADFLELDGENRKKLLLRRHFSLLMPRRLAKKIEKNNLQDPLFLQFVPSVEEEKKLEGFHLDPVSDKEFRKEPALLHKYEGRVLLLPTSACAMHCRYCFRQNFPYEGAPNLEEEIAYIRKDDSLHEVILSGGDPLSLSDASLFALLEKLTSIPHIRLIRFHTRFPIGIPERISPEFLSRLALIKTQIVFIIHANHVRELDEEVFSALKELQKLGVTLLCQTVLLKGVNDSYETLKDLFLTLASRGILPYYLHLLDKVNGAHHFEVSEKIGLALVEKLRASLPGYAVPLFVKEVPHASSKTAITS